MAIPYTEGGNPTEPYIASTDEFTRETDTTFIINSDPIRVQGHPYYKPTNQLCDLLNPSQFMVHKLELPDLRKLLQPPLPGRMSLDTEFPVWKFVGVRVDCSGPTCPAMTGMVQSYMQPDTTGFDQGVDPPPKKAASPGVFFVDPVTKVCTKDVEMSEAPLFRRKRSTTPEEEENDNRDEAAGLAHLVARSEEEDEEERQRRAMMEEEARRHAEESRRQREHEDVPNWPDDDEGVDDPEEDDDDPDDSASSASSHLPVLPPALAPGGPFALPVPPIPKLPPPPKKANPPSNGWPVYKPNCINWSMEHAQRQFLCVGCKPVLGCYEQWVGAALAVGYLERKTRDITAKDVMEFGYGNALPTKWPVITPKHFQSPDLAAVPVEMANMLCEETPRCPLLPDIIGMDSDDTGDRNFLCIGPKAVTGVRCGANAQAMDANRIDRPEPFTGASISPDPFTAKTAGMVSTANDIFNKSYWLNKAKGVNNGIIWGNNLYITFVDNMRGHIHKMQFQEQDDTPVPYNLKNSSMFLRHVKEYRIQVIVRKCYIKLESKLITSLLQLNKDWLKDMGFTFTQTVSPVGQFTDISAVHLPPTAQPAEEESDNSSDFIKIDCNGRCSYTHLSRKALAVDYHTHISPLPAAAAKKTAPKRAAK